MSRRNKGNKAKKSGAANASTAITSATQDQSPNRQSSLGPKPKRSVLIRFAQILATVIAILAGVATIAAGGGYFLEKWQETVATIDFSGDIDQKKPFSLPLVTINPSQIFSMHLPRMSCKINVEYVATNSAPYHAAVFADEEGKAGAEIRPGGTADFFCDAPAALTVIDKSNGAAVPVKQAEMTVLLNYETWVPWPIEREVTAYFIMFATSSGFRWIKGDWLSGHPAVPRPPILNRCRHFWSILVRSANNCPISHSCAQSVE